MQRLVLALLAVPLSLHSVWGQSVRFTGNGVVNTNFSGYSDPTGQSILYDAGGALTLEGEFAPDLKLPIPEVSWNFDIETNGQSVTVHEMRVSYSGTIEVNPFVTIDLDLDGAIEDEVFDINPSQTTVWTVQEHLFPDLSVSGTYYGLGLTQPFSGTLPRQSTFPSSSVLGLLDFSNWPDELSWNAQSFPRRIDGENVDVPFESRRFDAPSSAGWIGLEPFLHVRTVDLYEPLAVVLTPLVEALETADFNSDNAVNGSDFLTWQRSMGLLDVAELADGDANGDGSVGWEDLQVWKSQYGESASASNAAIPEPTTYALALTLLCLPIGRRWFR